MLKKVFNIFITIICIMSLIIPHLNVVMAAALTNDTSSVLMSVNLLTSAFHEGGDESTGSLSAEQKELYDNAPYKYIAKSGEAQTSILKIFREDDKESGTGKILFSDAFYCLDGNNSFPSLNGSITYNRTILDFFEENPISLGISNSDYNSLCWLLDNMYLRKQLSEGQRKIYKNILITNAFDDVLKDTSEPRTTVDDIKAVLTDDDIEVVQQWAIWYFTNNGETTIQGVPFVRKDGDNPILPLLYLQDTTLDEDSLVGTRYDYMNILYQYFVENALDFAGTETVREYPEIESKTISCERDGDYFKIGAFKVKSGSDDVDYEITLTDGENEIPSSKYIIKDKSGTVITDPINDILDEEYYIYILVNDNEYSKVQLNLSYNKLETKASVWQASEEDYQPVVLVTKEGDKVSENVSVEIEKLSFDLSLKKFINRVEDDTIINDYDRAPVVTYQDGEFTYQMSKDPVDVKVGNKVYYTIRVYNEGEIDGYAEEICDDIPKGLIFDSSNELNQEYGWVMYDKNGEVTDNPSNAVKIKTDYLSKEKSGQEDNNLIEAFDSIEETIDYKDVKAVFIVDETEQDKIIINTAEITDDCDKDGNDVDDVDSTPDNNDLDEDDIDQEKIKVKVFDLSLQKFITKINGVDVEESREPIVDVEPLKNGKNDATYQTVKDPLEVNIGDKVTYKIRVYNEGSVDGYVNEIVDYIPSGLGYLNEYNNNIDNYWSISSTDTKITLLGDINNGTKNLNLSQFFEVTDLEDATVVSAKNDNYLKVVTNKLEYDRTNNDNLIHAFNQDNDYLDYIDVEITCIVLSSEGLKNIAEISDDSDENGNDIIDRDSIPETVDPNNYPGEDETQDDNDIEYLTITNCDLSLKKFITNVNNEEITDRIPQVSYQDGEFYYTKNMDPVEVQSGDEVTYTLRIYNEGDVDCYASEVYDDIPDGLTFDPENSVNIQYGWVMYDANGNITTDSDKAVKIRTDYLSKEKSQARGKDALLHAVNIETSTIDYQDLKVVFDVDYNNNSTQIIINTAEISDITDINGDEIEDRDSIPDNGDESEDDLDKERIKTGIFDLSLQKFITSVNNTNITDREPKISVDEFGELSYTHPTTPLDVNTYDTVVYTIRVYNEGDIDGYVEEICDDIPDGLIFDPSNAINKQYEWVMYDENGKVVTDEYDAVKIKTKVLSIDDSTDNLIKAFDGNNLYFVDVKVAFIVSAFAGDNIIINTAEITDDADSKGNEIEDYDSTPNNNKEDEDDIDKERIKVGYFDLALSKDLVKAIVTEKDTTKEITAKSDSLMKIEINRKNINSTIVKFVYNITVTNEGNIEGYVTGIKDYIPDGLEFVEADNKDWTKSSNGIIENNSLAKTLIKPGESKTVQVVLRWVNGENNLGLKTNIAEISSDYNNANDVDDIDSVPDNQIIIEDDIDSAEVLLSISTGGKLQNYVLGIILLAGATGIGLLISRRVKI